MHLRVHGLDQTKPLAAAHLLEWASLSQSGVKRLALLSTRGNYADQVQKTNEGLGNRVKCGKLRAIPVGPKRTSGLGGPAQRVDRITIERLSQFSWLVGCFEL